MEVKWIKLSTDLFNNRKIRQIESMKDGDAIIVIWLKLLILAGELNDGGLVYFLNGVPFTEEQLATHFERDRETIALAMRTFEAFGMIETIDGIISICNWSKYQSTDRLEEIREYNRQAKQRQRAREKDVKDNVNDMSMTSQHRIDKKRIDKNREDIYTSSPDELQKALINRWRTNVDGDEANKEIRQ